MSRPTLFSALRSARRGAASPAAGARSFGRAAIFTGLLVLGRALWLRAASRRFRRIRGSRVGSLTATRTALPTAGASGGPASSGASWSSDRRTPGATPRPGARPSGGSTPAAGPDRPAAASSEGDTDDHDAEIVDGVVDVDPPEASA